MRHRRQSNSPALTPYGLALGSLSAECVLQTGCANLDIQLSDSGFTQAVFLQTAYGAADFGSGASTMQSAYESNSNVDFAETTLVETVGPFNGTGVFSERCLSGLPTRLQSMMSLPAAQVSTVLDTPQAEISPSRSHPPLPC